MGVTVGMRELEGLLGLGLEGRSAAVDGNVSFAAARTPAGRRLLLASRSANALPDAFRGDRLEAGGWHAALCPLSPANASALRDHFDWLKPRLLGLQTSAGLGDRLGLATPGHVRAVRAAAGVAPIFPQQSIREMSRTSRTPQQVMDDAMWGVFQEGWRDGFGADADHLKTPSDIDRCAAAGFTFFTFDPGEHVENEANTASIDALESRYEQLPWIRLAESPELLAARYIGRSFDAEGHTIPFDRATLLRAAVKYGRAVAHVAGMYRHLEKACAGRPFEVEVSVDETATPTTHAEHVFIVNELRRLGVQWVSLAPRYVGSFEKGVDYIGDLAEFESDFAVHAAIARAFGPYKLSLHSGSDKFSVYPIAMRLTRGLVHLKTAGTSYLEALRTIAAADAAFFRAIYVFARERYETDRASYHVSARLDRAPEPASLTDSDLPALLEQFDAREILHVTFGSVLTDRLAGSALRFYPRLIELLETHAEAYAGNLERHFRRHLLPFAAPLAAPSSVATQTATPGD